MKRYSTTKATALTGAALAGDVTLYLADGSTYPDPAVPGNGPYTVLVGYGSDREEICTVTAKPGANIITVSRGQDGSSATAKNSGDVVVHGVSKRDWDELLPVAGGTMTGALNLYDDPVADMEATTKGYVDLEVAGVLADVDSLGIWLPYTPTLGQGATPDIAKTVGTARYTKIGKTVHCHVRLVATGTGSLGGQISVSLPATAAAGYATVGSGMYLDAGTGMYVGVAALAADTHVVLYEDGAGAVAVGASPSIAVAATDEFRFAITYEAV